MTLRAFPPGFLFGFATSAHQVEGAGTEGGRGESVWDRYEATPGNIFDGSTAAVACDQLNRWPEDVALARELGAKAWRFSTAWSRVMPDGHTPNPAGLDFYDRLVDGLLAAGLRPFLTLNHWDLPQALQDAGGWPARETCGAFLDYAAAVTGRLGDRVKDWTTHNEPWCIARLGWETGEHAPGIRNPAAALRAAHHLLLSHGQAVPLIRAASAGARVGIVLNLTPAYAASPSLEDADAARRFDGAVNRWYLEPLLAGGYPVDAIADRVEQGHLPAGPLPFVERGDLEAISTPCDYLGINYYSRAILRSEVVPETRNQPRSLPAPPPARCTEMGWEIFPEGLVPLLLRVQRDYRPPEILLTEFGAAFADAPGEGGRIRNSRHHDYLRDHFTELARAAEAGVPLGGCFLWSLVDNFEWQHGYSKRFGVVWVDWSTQRRTPKDSASLVRDVFTAGAVDDGAAPR